MLRKTFLKKIFLALIVMFFIFSALTSCGKQEEKAEVSVPIPVTVDEDIREILENKSIEFSATSFDLIDKDHEANNITKLDAVILKLTAAYSPEKLQEKYLSKREEHLPPSDDLRREIQWIINNFDDLNEESQNKLQPFILLPDDPNSFFNPLNQDGDETILQKLSLVDKAFASGDAWNTLRLNISGKEDAGTIYYLGNSLTSDGIPMKKKAETIKEAVEKAWPLYKSLLRIEPEKHLAIYITDLKTERSSQEGAAYYLQDENTKELLSFHIGIEWSLSGDYLKSVTAHELFHIFQYHSMMEYEELEAWWLQEATAVWAENYVYPQVNREHIYLDTFFGNLEEQFISKEGVREYAGYMLFFFLSERYQNNDFIPDFILNSKGYDVANYIINSMDDFPETYSQFALWNWNRKPWKRYSDNGTFPSKRPYGTAVQNMILEDEVIAEDEIFLPSGGIGYRYYHVFQEAIDKIKFDFTDVPWNGHLKIQALYKVGEEWLTRDCTDLASVIFCRNKPSEKVKGVLLVFSNADLDVSKESLQVTFEVDTKGECPQTINGYTKITETMTYREGNAQASMAISYYSEDELEYDKERNAYVIVKRTLNYNIESDKSFPDTAFIGLGGNATSGSGSLMETYVIEEAPLRLKKIGQGGYFYPDPETRKTEWVNYSDTVLGNYTDTPMGLTFIFFGASGGIDLLPEDIKENGISGNRNAKVNVDDKMSMETTLEFSYNIK